MKVDGNKLVIEMARANIGVGELAEISKVARGTITRIKNGGIISVEPKTAGKISAALKIDVLGIKESN